MILFISVIICIPQYRTASLKRISDYEEIPDFLIRISSILIFPDKTYSDEFLYSVNVLHNTGLKAKHAVESNDFNEFNRCASFGYLLLARYAAHTSDIYTEEAVNKEAIKIWDKVSGGISFDSID